MIRIMNQKVTVTMDGDENVVGARATQSARQPNRVCLFLLLLFFHYFFVIGTLERDNANN